MSAKKEAADDIAGLFRRLTLGVYAIGVTDGQRRDAFTAAWIMQASFDPLLLAVSINPSNASYELLHITGGFTVNVLKQGQLELARRLGTRSGRDEDKLAGIRSRPGRFPSPILTRLPAKRGESLHRWRAWTGLRPLGRLTESPSLFTGISTRQN